MNDHEFLQAFEHTALTSFTHKDHIRMGWLYLRQSGDEAGIGKIRKGLQHLAIAHHMPDKYHETITLFWAKLVSYAIGQSSTINDFEMFIEQHAHLLDKSLLMRHYSPATLAMGRSAWMEPDLLPMPQ